MDARCRKGRIVVGEAERLDGERGWVEHRTPSTTRVSERGWGADAARAGEHLREPHELTTSGELLQPRCALGRSDAEELDDPGRRRAEDGDGDGRADRDKQFRHEARPERADVHLFTADARDRETLPDLHAHEQTELSGDEDADQLKAAKVGEQRSYSPSPPTPSPDREGGEGNADEDGLDEDGVIQVPEETRTRARILVSVEQDVRDPVAGQRGHQRRSEKQDAPVSASYEHGRSIPFDASFRVRRSSLALPGRRPVRPMD
jgi:hypothetical protein